MKQLTKQILLLMFFCSTLMVNAQNKLQVFEKYGRSESYSLTDIKKIWFSEYSGDVVWIQNSSGSSQGHEVEDIDYMGFEYSPGGINEILSEDINIYPNPVTDNLTVKYSENIDELKIFDLHGKLHLQLAPKKEIVDIDMSLFPTGVYFIRIVSDNKVGINKVIKSNN
ncbi:T9SS type A sorting domain-containing protein [Odoribacter sp. OttesenSCG-928-L07]|nr:T9SS type A sorting domain-containing protein [Odoribacter sp. OttesenSCG-928-L07]